jgi:hypothetical protein
MKKSRAQPRRDAHGRPTVTDTTARHHRTTHNGADRSDDALRSLEQWLDLIADLIVEDLRHEELRDADALRGVRPVQ